MHDIVVQSDSVAAAALGVLASEEGRLEEAHAQVALEAAIELEPQNSFALRSLGSLLVIAGAFAAGVARAWSRRWWWPASAEPAGSQAPVG